MDLGAIVMESWHSTQAISRNSSEFSWNSAAQDPTVVTGIVPAVLADGCVTQNPGQTSHSRAHQYPGYFPESSRKSSEFSRNSGTQIPP